MTRSGPCSQEEMVTNHEDTERLHPHLDLIGKYVWLARANVLWSRLWHGKVWRAGLHNRSKSDDFVVGSWDGTRVHLGMICTLLQRSGSARVWGAQWEVWGPYTHQIPTKESICGTSKRNKSKLQRLHVAVKQGPRFVSNIEMGLGFCMYFLCTHRLCPVMVEGGAPSGQKMIAGFERSLLIFHYHVLFLCSTYYYR